MFSLAGLICVFYYTRHIVAVSVQIDGSIDLGPGWSYEYKIVTPKSQYKHEHKHGNIGNIAKVEGTHKKNEPKAVTKLLDDFKRDIYTKPKIIEEDNQINSFTTHIFKQTLKVFKALRLKMSDHEIKKQIDFLSRNYESKFKEFVNETRKYKIKSRLGPQKVILNTIDMSNRILTRLINYLVGNMEEKGIRTNSTAANIFQREVEKDTKLEFDHACRKYGICRGGKGFTDFLSDLLEIIETSDNKHIKLAVDAFTEAFKNADFSETLDPITEEKLKKAIVALEGYDPHLLKAIVVIGKNVINNKNRPLIVHNRVSIQINQTLALLELFDMLDNIPNTEANSLERNDIKNSFQRWAHDGSNDILEIMESLIAHFKKSMAAMDPATQQRFAILLNMIG